jgi:3-hydroxyisobutyrate dehydrogenase-like beta-hydroxyacid dehydrogenase
MVRLVQIVGIVSPGAMGSAVGAAYLAAGNRVVATVDGRSARTTGLAEEARLELLPDLDAVVGESELVLSIVPPGEAGATAAAIAAAAGRTGSRPLVADWNAVSPATVRQLEQELAGAGLELVDGSI